jgi:hypothetical protein
MKTAPTYFATPKRRQISRIGSIQLLADLLADAEAEITKLRALWVKHHCHCAGRRAADPLNMARHTVECSYRKELS